LLAVNGWTAILLPGAFVIVFSPITSLAWLSVFFTTRNSASKVKPPLSEQGWYIRMIALGIFI
jgi:hypothetical protein